MCFAQGPLLLSPGGRLVGRSAVSENSNTARHLTGENTTPEEHECSAVEPHLLHDFLNVLANRLTETSFANGVMFF